MQFDAKPGQVTGVRSFSPEVGMIELDMDYALPAQARTLLVWSKCLPLLPQGHQQLFFIDDIRTGSSHNLAEDTLTPDHDSVEAEIPAASSSSSQPATAPVADASSSSPPRASRSFCSGSGTSSPATITCCSSRPCCWSATIFVRRRG